MPGWRPIRLRHKLAGPVQVVEVKGLYYIIAVQENGVIQVFHKDGHQAAGFPLRINEKISNSLLIEEGIDAATTEVTCVTNGGRLVVFNLLGETSTGYTVAQSSGWQKVSSKS